MVMARTLSDSGLAEMRMSPNRGSPWVAPGVPSGSPLSATTFTSMLAYWAHVSTARRISACHAWVLPGMEANRLLPTPSTDVPSGTKLMVRWVGSDHGTPKMAGTRRVSSSSRAKGVGRAIGFPAARVDRTEWSGDQGSTGPLGPQAGPNGASCRAARVRQAEFRGANRGPGVRATRVRPAAHDLAEVIYRLRLALFLFVNR